jgi:hypothetical protein
MENIERVKPTQHQLIRFDAIAGPEWSKVGPRGWETSLTDAELKAKSDAEWVEEAKRVQAGFEAVHGAARSLDNIANVIPFVVVTFLDKFEAIKGETYAQAIHIFKRPDGQPYSYAHMKNDATALKKIGSDNWQIGKLSVEAHKVIAPLEKKDQTAVLNKAAKYFDEHGRQMTVREIEELKDERLRTARTEMGDESKPRKDFRFSLSSYTHAAIAAKQKAADYIKEVSSDIDRHFKAKKAEVIEALKRYADEKYGAAQDKAEYDAEFAALLTDVPKEDRAQFDKLAADRLPMSTVKKAVKKYRETKALADKLDTVLKNVVDPKKRAELQTLVQSGTAIKEVKKLAVAHNKKVADLKTINDALDKAKITEEKDRRVFIDKLEAGGKVVSLKTEIRNAGKKQAADDKRLADITEAIKDLPEADRKELMGKAHAGLTLKKAKEEVNIRKSAQAEEQKKQLKKNREQREQWKKEEGAALKSANKAREKGEPKDIKIAEDYEKEALELRNKIETSEKADFQLTGGAVQSGESRTPRSSGNKKRTTRGKAKRKR